ncbi:Fis family transcriptional regulator [Burkholderia cenocepacia]|uniref:Fis family transcriptional regulator n=1 Tax=Burkholderia cenocepacia TaxID=95486 RepID=UPI002B2475FD|nr:Fis family transcriptional regulator [Burkholderia cenocepacia]MEB2605502.1 Fis family transcriptional regulator [Burkholderia cenocepacia]
MRTDGEPKMRGWTQRLDQSRVRSRADKTELLPLPKAIRDVLSLEYHLQLEALRAGAGSLTALRILLRVAMAAAMLREFGYGGQRLHAADEYERIAGDAYESGVEGRYGFDPAAFRLFAALVTDHDSQLETAPVRVIDIVARQLERPGTAQ